ncbi:MAG: 2-C-methyl-D-erythritol 4-phosphate cytidylyltransferase [Ginsengibacter sp.]
MKKFALIVAAGNGVRMNSEIPKQFILIKHKPILYYTIKSFIDAFEDIEIILVLPEESMAIGQEIVDGYFDNAKFRFCAGGRTRFHSVQNGLQLIDEGQESIIMVHDGVRCLLTPGLIRRCYDAANEFGTAIPVIPCKDSVRMVDENNENTIIDRNNLRLVQTPQTFHHKILQTAFKIDYKDQFTDEASVVEAFGIKLNLIAGEEYNIKMTTPIDLEIAKILLAE